MSLTKSQRINQGDLVMAIDDQVVFEKHCKEHLTDFRAQWAKATKAYNDALEALKNEDMHQAKRHNLATRAGNLILVKALSDIGMQEWRPQKQDKAKGHTQKATGAAVSSGVKPMKPLPKGMKGIQL